MNFIASVGSIGTVLVLAVSAAHQAAQSGSFAPLGTSHATGRIGHVKVQIKCGRLKPNHQADVTWQLRETSNILAGTNEFEWRSVGTMKTNFSLVLPIDTNLNWVVLHANTNLDPPYPVNKNCQRVFDSIDEVTGTRTNSIVRLRLDTTPVAYLESFPGCCPSASTWSVPPGAELLPLL